MPVALRSGGGNFSAFRQVLARLDGPQQAAMSQRFFLVEGARIIAKATLNQLLNFPCPRCRDVRCVSVESETATAILPRICPMRRTCESEVLSAYYVTMGAA